MDVERAYRAHGASMLRHAQLMLRSNDGAEDVVQEALIRAMRANPSFGDDEHERAWLLAVTGNVCRDTFRRMKRLRALPIDPLPILKDSPDEAAVRHERDIRLLRAVMELPMKYREPILLVYYHDLSQQQAAEALALSNTAFRTRLMRARRALKDMLGEEVLL